MSGTARTVDWDGDAVVLIDQTLLPDRFELLRIRDVAALCDAVARLAVRGAPALGVAGALGVALAAVRGEDVAAAAERITAARPTAVNLGWGVRRVLDRRAQGAQGMLDEALRVRDEEIACKVGTLSHAIAAHHHGLPFVVVAPESSVDLAIQSGTDIPIEERDPGEVLGWAGRRTAPSGTGALNPAFDVTPAALVTAVVTERRVVRPALGETLRGS